MPKKIILAVIILIAVFGVIFIKQKGGDNLSKQTMNNDTQPKDISGQNSPTPQVGQPEQKGPVPMEIDKNKKYTAFFETSAGEITIDLYAGETPITVNNFVYLAKKNFYDGTTFHRVIKGFMIQGGDPKGDGTGGPGYKFDDEPFQGDYKRGTVAMANAGPNTNGSQFFIIHQDYDLPKNYVIFGQVISGLETVDKIAQAPTTSNPTTGENSKPVSPAKINSIRIEEK